MTEIVIPPETTPPEPPPPEAPAPRVPEAPPPLAWVEAEARANALAVTLDGTAQAQWQGWMDAVASEVLEPLQALVKQVTTTHRRLADEAALDDATAPGDLWRRATAYRHATAETVLVTLRGFLAKRKFGDALGAGCLKIVEPLGPLADGATSHCTMSRPITLYAPSAQDSLPRRVRKAFVRAQRRFEQTYLVLFNGLRRLFRLDPLPLPPLQRLAPVRELCAYHVRVRVPGRLAPLHEAVQQHVAALVGRLEAALTDWTHAILDAERQFDRLAFHQPDILQTLHVVGAEDEEAPADAVDPEAVAALAAAADALQRALTEAAEAMTLPPEIDADAILHAAADELKEDLRRAGTFLLNLKKRRIPPPESRPEARIEKRRQSWAVWHQQTVDRLTLNGRLMALRKEMLDLQDALLKRISSASLRPVLRTFQPEADRLREAEQQAAQIISDADSDDLETLHAALHDLQQQTMTALREALSDLPGLVSADQALAEPGRAEWAALCKAVEQFPEHLFIHAVPRGEKALTPDKKPWRMDVRLSVKDLLHPFPELLAEPAAPLRKQIVRIWGETEQVSHIVQYNLDVALDVLKATPEDAEPAEDAEDQPSKDPLEDARELATDGLRRAADTLMDLARSLEAPWLTFSGAVFQVFQNDWADVHRSARTEAFVEEQWYDFWMRARRQTQRLRRRARELWEEYSKIALRLFRKGRRGAQELIERGRSAIGTVEATEEDRLRTIDAISLANIQTLQQGLPLVYRKLFSLRSVNEPSLLEGREADLKRINQHFRRWKQRQAAGALVLPMPMGSGRTSLLNVAGATLQAQADVSTLSLEKRLFDTSEFAARMAEALDIEVIGEPSLEALEAQLLDTPRPQRPRVCLIDNLEHLLLRTLGGADLVERVLIFFSRTDRQICWIATIGDYTWRFLEKTLGTATGLVTAYRSSALNAATVEAIIINRHRRSGMVLRFAEPKDLSALARRRLNRARAPEARQAILREMYFERLHRLSGQNVMLMLFYWLRSTDFKAEEGILTIQPVQPLSFRFFESFDLARAFTLKAFMLHHTLTLAEHNRVFRMDDAQSTYLLESLLNLGLIEPSSRDARRDATGNPTRIIPDERYRLHPLILHPTFQLLKERNIIH